MIKCGTNQYFFYNRFSKEVEMNYEAAIRGPESAAKLTLTHFINFLV